MLFRDPHAPPADRVADLLGRLTLAEKLGLLHQYQAPVQRLGIEAFRTGTEALHGVAWLGEATVFPQALGLATAWDPEFMRRVGEAVGTEVAEFHRRDPAGVSRNVWAPVVNPLRDPRWGRNEEGYSEDPWLTGLLGEAYARGLAGDGPTLRTAPTLKHFLGYNNETDRHLTSSNLPPRVLHEYELPAYRPALASGAAIAVMPSYNLVNGCPAHLSPLLTQLRAWAPDEILLVSDAEAPGNLAGDQQIFPDRPAAYAAALKAGIDSFTQDGDRPAETLAHLRTALDRGLITEADVDLAAGRALSLRLRLDEFDPPVPYTSVVHGEHERLAREAAVRAFVLLENDGLLPLRSVQRVAVVGPLAGKLQTDWYSGTLPYAVTPAGGLAERCETVFCDGVDRIRLSVGKQVLGEFDVFGWGGGTIALRSVDNGCYLSLREDGTVVADAEEPGGWVVRESFRFDDDRLLHLASGTYLGRVASGWGPVGKRADADRFRIEVLRDGAEEAAELAATCDVAIVVVGDHPMINGRETEDRTTLALGAAQDGLARAVLDANDRTVLVLVGGCPLTWTAPAHTVLWSAHGGQEYGRALADVLFGDEEPTGRLTQTWYRSERELPDLYDYDIIAADSTYLYFRGSPQYPFGHGLSYTTFDYSALSVAVGAEEFTATVTVTNTGDRPGSELVQLYTHQQRSRVKQPLRRLRAFTRLYLPAKASRTVTLTVPLSDLAFWDVTRSRPVVEAAPHRLMVGSSATALRLSTTLEVPGETIPPRTGPLRAADHDAYDGVTLTDRDAVRSEAAGAWIAFHDVDLTAATAITADAPVTLRLKDPLYGPLVTTLPLSVPADLYAVFETPGVTLSQLTIVAPG